MSHQLLAAIWEQLARPDVANILREMMGEHALDLAERHLHGGLPSNVEPLMRIVYWVRAIFDLQRTYLQGTASASDSHPCLQAYLLSSDVIYATLMYLVRLKSEVLPGATATIREFAQHRYYVAQTLLVGVRVLVLRGEDMLVDKKSNLERAMRAAWQHAGLSNTEYALANDILPRAIDSIGQPPNYSPPEKDSLPSFVAGLYPCRIPSETHLSSTLATIIQDRDPTMSSFWSLFDTLWAAEAALIQCQVDYRFHSRGEGYTSRETLRVQDALHLAVEARSDLESRIRTVCASRDVPALDVLVSMLLALEVNEPQAPFDRQLQEAGRYLNSTSVLHSACSHFVRWLIDRRMQLWDCNGELEAVSSEYHRNLKQWIQSVSSTGEGHQPPESSSRSNTVYIVDCPAVHPVSRMLLEERLGSSDQKALKQLQENPKLLTVDMCCPLCPGNVRIQHARRIEPLDQLSLTLYTPTESSDSSLSRHSILGSLRRTSGSLSLSNPGTTSTNPTSLHVEPAEVPKPPPSTKSVSSPSLSGMTGNQSMTTIAEALHSPPPRARTMPGQVQTSQSTKSPLRDLKLLKRPFTSRSSSTKKSERRENRFPAQPRYCFSAAGTVLFFWAENGNWVMRFDVAHGEAPSCHRYDVSGVQFVAGGTNRCAVVASVGEHYDLIVFEGTNTTGSAYTSIDPRRKRLSSLNLTMSRDDQYISLTIRDEVHIYQIGVGTLQRTVLAGDTDSYPIRDVHATAQGLSKRPLSPREAAQEDQRQRAVIERKVQFSVDARSLIVATHLGDHYAYVDVWGSQGRTWTISHSQSFKLPPWTTNDGDLTSVFYDHYRGLAFLSAFFGKEYPMLFPVKDAGENFASDACSPRILHAAQSPSAARYVIANGVGELYLCDYKPNGTLNPYRMKKGASKIPSSVFKPGLLLLSLPEEDRVLAAWTKDSKLILRTIQVSDRTETFQDCILKPDFDRLVAERAPTSTLLLAPRRPSELSSHAIAEMADTGVVLKPRFSELPAAD